MKTATDQLKALLATGQFHMADLYTITLEDGTVLRYTTADIDLDVPEPLLTAGTPYPPARPWRTFRSALSLFERSQITWKLGLEVETIDIQAYPDAGDLVKGLPFIQALERGYFDGAEIQVERIFMPIRDYTDTSAGPIILWAGRMGDIEDFGRTSAPLRCNSHLELLNIKIPRNQYQPACMHTLYDAGCGVVKAGYQVLGNAGSGATASAISVPSTGKPDGWFDQGIIIIGGISRTVKKWASEVAVTILPFESTPAAGTPVILLPGCDKTKATCESKFANLINFRGYPYVPVPETSV